MNLAVSADPALVAFYGRAFLLYAGGELQRQQLYRCLEAIVLRPTGANDHPHLDQNAMGDLAGTWFTSLAKQTSTARLIDLPLVQLDSEEDPRALALSVFHHTVHDEILRTLEKHGPSSLTRSDFALLGTIWHELSSLRDSEVDERVRSLAAVRARMARSTSFFLHWENATTKAIGECTRAALVMIAHEIWLAIVTTLGSDTAAATRVAQALTLHGHPWLEVNLALLRGRTSHARLLLASQPGFSTIEPAWCDLLEGHHQRALAQMLDEQGQPRYPNHGSVYGFPRFLARLAQELQATTHGQSSLVGWTDGPRQLLPAEAALKAWFTARDDSYEQPIGDGKMTDAFADLLLASRRKRRSEKALPLAWQSRLVQHSTKLPAQAWGQGEIATLLTQAPTAGLGLGLTGQAQAWHLALAQLEQANPRRKGEASRADWLLVIDSHALHIDDILVRAQHENGRFYNPNTAGGWSSSLSTSDRDLFLQCKQWTKASAPLQANTMLVAILRQLENHPHLYFTWGEGRETPGRLQILTPQLKIHSEGESDLVVWTPELNVSGYALRWRLDQLEVYTPSVEQETLAKAIGHGLRIPHPQKPAFATHLARWLAPPTSSQSPGSTSELPTIEASSGIPADSHLHVVVQSLGDAIVAHLRVRPLANATFMAPAQGEERVQVQVGSVTLPVERDLQEEYAEVLALSHRHPHLIELTHWNGEIRAETALGMLDLSRKLHHARDVLTVHWPPQVPQVVGSLHRATATITAHWQPNGPWLELQAEFYLDEKVVLNLSQVLQHLHDHEGPFVALDDLRYVALDEPLHAHLRLLLSLAQENLQVIRISRFLAPVIEEIVSARGQALQVFADIHHLAAQPPAVPAALQGTLRPYQVEGFQWLTKMATWGAGAVLADDMGLGKTVMTLTWLLHRARSPRRCGPSLIVMPTSLLGTWQAQAEHFAPRLRIHHWSSLRKRSGERLQRLNGRDVVFVSYTLLVHDGDVLQSLRWQAVVFDEAQALKNPRSKRSIQATRLHADFRLALTGTPLENRLSELWSLFRVLNPGLLGSRDRFERRFVGPIEKTADHAALTRLHTLLAPFLLRRTRDAVLHELPARIEIIRPVRPDKDERLLYESQRRQALQRVDATNEAELGRRQITVLAELMRLRRLCCDPRLVVPDWQGGCAKLETLRQLVGELQHAGHKALIFSQFVDLLTRVREWMQSAGIAHHYLDGQSSSARRQEAILDFQAGGSEFFLISLRAGGVGINLTAANYVIILDPWWNPAVEDQASARAHRMGQTRSVTVVRLVNEGTIEEKIAQLHASKRELVAHVLAAADEKVRPVDLQAMIELLRDA